MNVALERPKTTPPHPERPHEVPCSTPGSPERPHEPPLGTPRTLPGSIQTPVGSLSGRTLGVFDTCFMYI